jgi:hypothetical protein
MPIRGSRLNKHRLGKGGVLLPRGWLPICFYIPVDGFPECGFSATPGGIPNPA